MTSQTNLPSRISIGTLCLLLQALLATWVFAAEPQPDTPVERTLFVPFESLPLLLEGPNERVFMTREEYRQLRDEAQSNPPQVPPALAIVLAANYEGRVEENLATIRGTLEVEVLQTGLQMIPLQFQGVALRSASLDDQRAPVARDDKGRLVLFIREPGKHLLTVELQTPVQVAAAQQSLQFQLPSAGSTKLNLVVPGNIEVKQGASVVQRDYDADTDQTHFDLLPADTSVALVMSLNNRRLRQGRVVAARSVIVSELTTSYERLHVTAEMRVLHGATDRFLFDVPTGFQITAVDSPLLQQWLLQNIEGRQVLEITLREPTRSTETLHIAASREPVEIGQWSMPQLQPRDVAGHVAVVGLIAETRLRPLEISAENLLQLDTAILREALPSSVFDTEPGAPTVRTIAAYYAPGEQFHLSARLENPQDELRVATHLLLSLSEQQQALRGGFTLTPQASKLVSFVFQLPTDWQLTRLTTAEQQPLEYDLYQTNDGTRHFVRLPQAVEPSQSFTVFFEAVHQSSQWLAAWEEAEVTFPRVIVEQATDISGAIAVETEGDLLADPLETGGLVPLDSQERSRFGLAASNTELTWQITDDQYQTRLRVTRQRPRMASRNYSFFRVKEGTLVAHHEVVFLIERAHARNLRLRLPATTPTALSIRGLDNIRLKEFNHVSEGDQNVWSVLLAKPEINTVRLAIDYEQRLDESDPLEFQLPIVHTDDVSFQTQMVTVEGDPALDVVLDTQMRRVDVGELAEADYSPGPRLLGAYASTSGDETVQVRVSRRELRPLPAAIVKRAELVTVVAASGISQSSARYLLQTKVPFLAIALPPETELWSVTLNNKPVKPRRRGNQILLSLQADSRNQDRDLRVVYQSPSSRLAWLGEVSSEAPQLQLLADDETGQGMTVPQVDLVWHLFLPSGYKLSRVRGNVFPQEQVASLSPLRALAQATWTAGGGVPAYSLMLSAKEMRMATAVRDRSKLEAMEALLEAEHDAAILIDGQSRAGNVTFGDDAVTDAEGQSRMESESLMRHQAPPTSGRAAQPYPNSAGMGGYGGGGYGGNVDPFRGVDRAADGELGYGEEGGSGSSDARYDSDYGMHYGDAGAGDAGGMMGGGDVAGQPAPPMAAQMAAPQAASQSGNGQTNQPLDAAGNSDGQVTQPSMSPAGQIRASDLSSASSGSDRITPMSGKYWALQGLRGLTIKIDHAGQELTFHSLGETPELDVTVFQESRMQWLAAGVAALLFMAGLLMTGWSVSRRLAFIFAIVLLASGLPILGGPTVEFATVFRYALWAALALLPFWVFFAVVARVWHWLFTPRSMPAAVSTGVLALILTTVTGLATPVCAQDLSELLAPLLEETKPLKIPADAVVIPYDPEDVQWQNNASKVLVPYDRYVQLWNQAHPDQPLQQDQAQQAFALAGARYTTTLVDEEQIVLTGTLECEVYTDQPVEVPLALSNAVISQALLDGQPARLKTVAASPPAAQQESQAAAPSVDLLILLVEGAGRHELELTVRIPVNRRGGWRIAQANVPYAEATSLQLMVPQAGTTVRRSLNNTTLTNVSDRDAQTWDATLAAGGRFDVTWRAKTSPGSVDQALTASSQALVDVREDGLRVVWQVKLTFGQTERGLFRLQVPEDYLVEHVDGDNVRGWETTREAGKSLVTVELLKAVKQHEQLTLHLSQRASLADSESRDFATPFVSIPDAALHRGVIQIRRSPVLELQTLDIEGVTRTDGASVIQALDPAIGTQKSPLGVREYQAYQFNATPFRIALSVSQIHPLVAAQLRTIHRIGETEASLECEIQFDSQRRSVYSVDVAVPDQLQIEQVQADGLTDWARVTLDGRSVLRAFFSAGRAGRFVLSVAGKLNSHTPRDAVALPQLEVLGAEQQRGSIAVQVDPSLDARATQLNGCRSVLLQQVTSWLNTEQRPWARLGFEYNDNAYSGKIQLSPRAPRVTCDSITNVRVTYRDIQDTLLLDFSIQDAGVRQIRFRLPKSLQEADIIAPRIRQKSITPIEQEEYVQVQLDLQDAITGQYRVVITHDRAITSERHEAPLPVLEAGVVRNRYVTLENAGRDEIVLEGTTEMEPLDRQSRQWEHLTRRLQGGDFTMAYVAQNAGDQCTFGYRTKQRVRVETAGASIGLARTEVVVDASGAYRAAIVLKVDNRTEPYLEIELPARAQLWTAHVADQPVKPAQALGAANDSQLRIPLIKTAEGDLDYEVVLKYAGQLANLQTLQTVSFPFIRTLNIHVELSQVELHLPEDYQWYMFEGTADQVDGEQDFDAEFVAYQTQQVEKLTQIIRGSNQFSQSRAIYNMGKLGQALEKWSDEDSGRNVNEKLQLNLYSNTRILKAAEEEIKELAEKLDAVTDNREILNSFFEQQRNEPAANGVIRLGENFAAPELAAPADMAEQAAGTRFNQSWFLDSVPEKGKKVDAVDKKMKGQAPSSFSGSARLQSGKSYRVQQQAQAPEEADAAQQVFQVPPARKSSSGNERDWGTQAKSRQVGETPRAKQLETKSELNRAYQEKIQQSDQAQSQPTEMLGESYERSGARYRNRQSDERFEGLTVDSAPQGLSSLDFQLPRHGRTYYFTTPGGEVEISSRPLRKVFGQRLASFLGLLALMLGLALGYAAVKRLSRSRAGRIVCIMLLCGIGLLMLLVGILPIFAFAIFLGSILLALDWRHPVPAA